MKPVDALRPHVEQTVRTYLGLDPHEVLTVDDEGDIPIRSGSALYFVSMLDRDPVLVRVWSIVLDEVTSSPDLLAEINDINSSVVVVRLFLLEDRVLAVAELRADTLDLDELAFACDSIGALADWVDDTLQIRFGGRRHFTSE